MFQKTTWHKWDLAKFRPRELWNRKIPDSGRVVTKQLKYGSSKNGPTAWNKGGLCAFGIGMFPGLTFWKNGWPWHRVRSESNGVPSQGSTLMEPVANTRPVDTLAAMGFLELRLIRCNSRTRTTVTNPLVMTPGLKTSSSRSYHLPSNLTTRGVKERSPYISG